MPIPTEYFRWWITDVRTGKRRRTRYAMTRAGAKKRLATGELLMNMIAGLCLLLASAAASAVETPAHSASAPTVPQPRSDQPTPFSGPPDPRWGPRQSIQVDIDAAMNSRSITFNLDGQTYEFKGRLVPNEGSVRLVRDPVTKQFSRVAENDGSVIWRSYDEETNRLHVVRFVDGSFWGTLQADGRSFQFRGQGRNAVLVEIYRRPRHAPE